jgi:hypothetical protein
MYATFTPADFMIPVAVSVAALMWAYKDIPAVHNIVNDLVIPVGEAAITFAAQMADDLKDFGNFVIGRDL